MVRVRLLHKGLCRVEVQTSVELMLSRRMATVALCVHVKICSLHSSCCPFPSGVAHPLICFLDSVYAANRPWAQAYIEQLLCPQDWFSFWRLNCRLASYHALVTGCDGYRQEDKVGCVGCQRIIPGCPGEMQPSLTNRTLRHAT